MGYKKKKELREVILPKTGKLISEFAKEISNVINKENILFFRPESREVIEIGLIDPSEEDEGSYTGFVQMKPNRFITLSEKYFIPVAEIFNNNVPYYHPRSMSNSLSSILLESQEIQNSLPKINRIFNFPLPIIYNKKLTFPKKGYDKRFKSWMPYDAPEIENPKMSIEEAKQILIDIYSEFCFQSEQDYINCISALLTPFLKGLFSD